MSKTNFDRYLEEQLRDPAFAERFKQAGEAWDVALHLTALRKQAGLSQKQLAAKLHTSQQNISRLESPSYKGHYLTMLRRVAEALGANIRILIEPEHSKLTQTKLAKTVHSGRPPCTLRTTNEQ